MADTGLSGGTPQAGGNNSLSQAFMSNAPANVPGAPQQLPTITQPQRQPLPQIPMPQMRPQPVQQTQAPTMWGDPSKRHRGMSNAEFTSRGFQGDYGAFQQEMDYRDRILRQLAAQRPAQAQASAPVPAQFPSPAQRLAAAINQRARNRG